MWFQILSLVVQFTSFWVCEANGKAGEGIVLCFAWLDNLVCRLCFSVFVLMQSCVFLSFGYQFAGYGWFWTRFRVEMSLVMTFA